MVDLQPLALVDCWRLEAAYNKRLNNQSSTLAVDVRSFSNSDYSNSMADKEENRFSLNLSRLSSGSQISGSTRETTTEKSKVLSQMAEDDLTFPLLALSDVAKARRRYMKVYPNKVYTPWYRRYVNCLPDGQRIDFQPGVEIRKVDEDIALQYFYGEDTPYIDEPTTKESNERRAQTLRRYTKLMEMRERTQSAKSETKQLDFNVSLQRQEDFGPTVTQRAKIVPIINFMDKLKTLKMRQIRTVPKLQPNSKWKLFQLPLMRLKLRQYIKSTKQAAVRYTVAL
uniref:Uncharacterized protein n=1 Tax=Biomphalaria glabrata TaxID=6526 RepID=A0A2C9L5X7_BIOGL